VVYHGVSVALCKSDDVIDSGKSLRVLPMFEAEQTKSLDVLQDVISRLLLYSIVTL
jgi:hypothetical protein